MRRVPEVDDLINHAAKIPVFIEDNFLMLEQSHDSTQPSELVPTETFYRANGEVIKLPIIKENPLHIALKRFLIGDDFWEDDDG